MTIDARGYYVTKLSENMGYTPVEGYLICREVPLARTGWQEYVGQEVTPQDHAAFDTKVRVYRSEDEVFNPATLASFNGKTVTDTHPSEWVTKNNESEYHRGHAQNIHRGTGEYADCIMGDLVIKDPNLIHKVEHGEREVSCGYYCIYVPIGKSGDMYAQKMIRGNHIAIVPRGRAGERIAIRDSAPDKLINDNNSKKERSKKMVSTDIWKRIKALGFQTWARDAKPEEVAEAMESYEKPAEEGGASEKKPEEQKPEAGGNKEDRVYAMVEKVLAVVEALASRLDKIEASNPPPPEPEEELDAMAEEFGKPEEQLPGQDAEEEEKKKQAEALKGAGQAPFLDADVFPDPPELSGEDLPKNPIPGADRKMVRDFIVGMKPIIAALPDRATKDAAVAMMKKTLDGFKTPSKQPGARYVDLHQLQRSTDEMSEARARRAEGVGPEEGEKIREKHFRKHVTK